MDKQEIAAGLRAGRSLIQEEWSTPAEIQAVDELVAEGIASATDWAWSDGFQCERRYVTGKADASLQKETVDHG